LNSNQLKLLPHTIWYLKPTQVVYRLKVLTNTRFPLIRKNYTYVSDIKPKWIPLSTKSDFPNRTWLSSDEIVKGRFTFLNQTEDFGSDILWSATEKGRLWRYNLHYFDYLFSNRVLDKQTADRLIDSWVAENPPGTSDAWDPFPISLRLVNWIKYFCQVECSSQEITRSAYNQTLWLERNLEYHLLANHLFKNAKALVFTGLFFEGTEDANRWLSKGIRLLDEQIAEQVLHDGGHFERSPMYHAMILEDCLDLLNITHNCIQPRIIKLREKLEAATDRMINYLDGMCHPDGQISLFNDAAFGIEHTPQALFDYYEGVTGKKANFKEGKSWSFPETGYYVMASTAGDRMFIDCGPVGPDYQLGHSHCDTLSFELSLDGRRVIIDSGCFQYEDGPIRKYNRGNAGHNTVTIDSENQSEVWGAHRCARRSRPIYANLNELDDGSLRFEGAHDGYKRLKGQPIHHRSVTWKDNEIAIDDRVEGSGAHDVESRLHIHPNLKVEGSDEGFHVSDSDHLLMTVKVTGQGRVTVEEGWYCPEFGLKFKCPLISLKLKNASLPIKCGWNFRIHKGS